MYYLFSFYFFLHSFVFFFLIFNSGFRNLSQFKIKPEQINTDFFSSFLLLPVSFHFCFNASSYNVFINDINLNLLFFFFFSLSLMSDRIIIIIIIHFFLRLLLFFSTLYCQFRMFL